MSLTDAELTILGLLAEQPRHGYELEKVIDERGIRNWTAVGFSSIYYLLDKLAGRGLIEPVEPVRSRTSRAAFRPTASGRKACAAESLGAIGDQVPVHARVLVGLANSPGLPATEVAGRLADRAAALQQRLDELADARARQGSLPLAAIAIFTYSEAMLRADLDWTRQTLAMINEENDMDRFEIKKVHKALYSPTAKAFSLVDVPRVRYLAIDGHGDPNTSLDYAQAVECLYSIAYTVKFASKKTLGRDLVVSPLEGLWRAEDMASYTNRDKDAWDWTMMIAQPDWVTQEMVDDALATATAKKALPAAGQLRLIDLEEGRCVQILHLGSYDDEGPVLDRLHHEFIPANGLTFNGDHHEIYLSDARRTPPEKRKTILRQPVRPVHG